LRYDHLGLLPTAKYFGIQAVAPSPSAPTPTTAILAPTTPSEQSQHEAEFHWAAIANVAHSNTSSVSNNERTLLPSKSLT